VDRCLGAVEGLNTACGKTVQKSEKWKMLQVEIMLSHRFGID
jgi:hypothetical protein